MNTTVKKAAPKKKAAAKAAPTKSLIKYAEKSLKPANGSLLHPIYHNNPDMLRVMPKSMFKIRTGLEIAVPPNMVLMSSINIQGAIQIGSHYHGYQKELVLNLWNLTDTLLEIDPCQKVGYIFLAEMKAWK
jgi:dUTPase